MVDYYVLLVGFGFHFYVAFGTEGRFSCHGLIEILAAIYGYNCCPKNLEFSQTRIAKSAFKQDL